MNEIPSHKESAETPNAADEFHKNNAPLEKAVAQTFSTPDEYYRTHRDFFEKRAKDNAALVNHYLSDNPAIAPTDEEGVLELARAQRGLSAHHIAWDFHRTGTLPPEISEGAWIAPLRLTFASLSGAVTREINDIITAKDTEELFGTARNKALWAGFRATSGQRNIIRTEVLLSGPFLLEGETINWCDIELMTPEARAELDRSLREVIGEMNAKGYEFPED